MKATKRHTSNEGGSRGQSHKKEIASRAQVHPRPRASSHSLRLVSSRSVSYQRVKPIRNSHCHNIMGSPETQPRGPRETLACFPDADPLGVPTKYAPTQYKRDLWIYPSHHDETLSLALDCSLPRARLLSPSGMV
jgi:hypothetical protein